MGEWANAMREVTRLEALKRIIEMKTCGVS